VTIALNLVLEFFKNEKDKFGYSRINLTPGQRFFDSFGDRDPASLTADEVTSWLKPISGTTHRSWLVQLCRFGIQKGHMRENVAYTPVQKPPRTAFLVSQKIP
jgi:hypothetical protein